MPYEEITEQQYNTMKKPIKSLDFSGISEDSTPEKYCDSDHCEVVLGE